MVGICRSVGKKHSPKQYKNYAHSRIIDVFAKKSDYFGQRVQKRRIVITVANILTVIFVVYLPIQQIAVVVQLQICLSVITNDFFYIQHTLLRIFVLKIKIEFKRAFVFIAVISVYYIYIKIASNRFFSFDF